MPALSSVMADRATKVLRDFVDGGRMWELWGTLGWNDISQRYRRSVIGPFWLTLSMGVMVGTIGFVYSVLFGQPLREYLPYLALGFIAWSLLYAIITESCFVFIGSEGIIRQVHVPYSVHVFRMLWRNLAVFAHNFIIYIIVVVAFGIRPTAALLIVVPSLLLICVNGLWLGMLMATLNARFRDLQLMLFNVMQIIFYVTPIVWRPQQLSSHSWVFNANPLYHFIEMLRLPLLGQVPPTLTWVSVLTVTILGWLVTFLFLMRFRGRIAYWL